MTGTWQEIARAAARRGEDREQALELRQLLSFRVDGSQYAVPVESVREIVRMRPVTPIPRVAADILGVISLRGEIVQVVDLRRRLGLAAAQPDRSSRIIVVHAEDGRVAGLLVDAVVEVLRVTDDAISSPVGPEAGAVHALCARGDEFVSLVDLGRVLEIDAES